MDQSFFQGQCFSRTEKGEKVIHFFTEGSRNSLGRGREFTLFAYSSAASTTMSHPVESISATPRDVSSQAYYNSSLYNVKRGEKAEQHPHFATFSSTRTKKFNLHFAVDSERGVSLRNNGNSKSRDPITYKAKESLAFSRSIPFSFRSSSNFCRSLDICSSSDRS